MKYLILSPTLLFVLFSSICPSVSFAAAKSEVGVLGFQAWKASRIEEGRSAVDRLSDQEKENATPTPKSARKNKHEVSNRLQAIPKLGRVDQRLQQAQINLEMAQELTVNDYFVLYLSQFKQKEAFVEAAKKLSAEEAADLMMSYQKRLSSGESDPAASAALGAVFNGASSIK